MLPAHSYDLFEYHALIITDPFKLYLVVIYHPQGQLGSFVNELDILLSAPPMDNCPLLILGDMNIHIDISHSEDFLSLLHSFNLKRVHSSPTHDAGKDHRSYSITQLYFRKANGYSYKRTFHSDLRPACACVCVCVCVSCVASIK